MLPVKLLKLRLGGCNLTTLPPAVAWLTALEDLVLSDNTLRDADMSVRVYAHSGSPCPYAMAATLHASRCGYLPFLLNLQY